MTYHTQIRSDRNFHSPMNESESNKDQVATDTVNEDVKYESLEEPVIKEIMIPEQTTIQQDDQESECPSCIECEVVWPSSTPPSSPKSFNPEMTTYSRTISNNPEVNSPRLAHNIKTVPVKSDLSNNASNCSTKSVSLQRILYRTPDFSLYECEHSPACRGNNQMSYSAKKKTSNYSSKSKGSSKHSTPTTSDKESAGDNSESSELKYYKIVPIKTNKNSDNISYSSGYEVYSVKVDQLRKDMEAILSDWVLTVKNHVSDSFYENVRKAFEAFIADVENYNKHKLKYKTANEYHNQHPPISYRANAKSYLSDATLNRTSSKNSSIAFGNGAYGPALTLVHRISEKLQDLIDMLEKFKEEKLNRQSSFKAEKLKHKSHDHKEKKGEKDVEQIIKYTVEKLKKYKSKHSDKHKKHVLSDEKLKKKSDKICDDTPKYPKSHGDDYSYKPVIDSGVKVALWMRKKEKNEQKAPETAHRDCCTYHRSKYAY